MTALANSQLSRQLSYREIDNKPRLFNCCSTPVERHGGYPPDMACG
jgi:hypothetical protein